MELKDIYRWTREYTWGIDASKIEWVVMDTYHLMEFFDKNYLDVDCWNYATDDLLDHHPVGMHYLTFRRESPDMRYLIGMCDNKIGRKTIIGCISYVENYKLFTNQSVPLTYLCTCEINKYFRNRGLSKIMFDEFAKVINPNQHFIATPQSPDGGFCHVHDNLRKSLVNNGFSKSITLKDEFTDLFNPEFRSMICEEEMQLKMK